MKKLHIETFITVYESTSELSVTDKELIEKAKEVRKNAYAPYSNFLVGAVLL